MGKLHIRPATSNDLATLRRFEQGVISAERPYARNLRLGNIRYYDLEALIALNRAEVLVGELAGTPVASGYIRIENEQAHFYPDQFAYLGFLYVEPEYRGQGLILELVEGLFAWARARGIESFKLDVFAENASAIRAYQKLGFLPNLLELIKQDK